MAPRLSDRLTLLIPVAHDRLPIAAVWASDGIAFVRKTEHHITVFGFDIGKAIGAVVAKAPDLRATIDAIAAEADFDWTLPAVPTLWRLHRDKPRDLQTVIALVDAPGIAGFFAACAAIPELAHLPWDPPPPHITLYTSDPTGKDGIGLRRPADLEEAQRRAAAGEITGLRAFAASL